jgi:hypothetical protein
MAYLRKSFSKFYVYWSRAPGDGEINGIEAKENQLLAVDDILLTYEEIKINPSDCIAKLIRYYKKQNCHLDLKDWQELIDALMDFMLDVEEEFPDTKPGEKS